MSYEYAQIGPPKGVMLTHANLVSNIVQQVELQKKDFFKPNFQASTVCILPMFHMFGLGITSLLMLHIGGRITTLPRFDPQIFLQILERTKPNIMHFTPPLVQFCTYNPKVTPEHLASLEYIHIGAAPLGQTLAKKFKEKAPHCQCRDAWGMTEASPTGTMTLPDQEVLGSCGILLPNTEAKIIDLSTSESLGPNKQGELCIRGPQVSHHS